MGAFLLNRGGAGLLVRARKASAVGTAGAGVALLVSTLAGATGHHLERGLGTGSTGARVAVASTLATFPTRVPCLNLPISSADVGPSSCWQVSPTDWVVAGRSGRSASEGAVAVIAGQRKAVTLFPGSGPISITTANGQSACLRSAVGTGYLLSVLTGKLAAVSDTSACTTSSGAAAKTASAQSRLPPRTQTVSTLSDAGALAPTVTPSYYEYYSYLAECGPTSAAGCPIYRQGQSTYTPSSNGLVVLDFGAPCYVVGSGAYGSQLFGGAVCVPDSTLRVLVDAWMRGYASDHGAGTADLTVAIGTSNSLNGVDPRYALTAAQMQASGRTWYQQLVGAIGTAGQPAPLTLWAASDIEQSSDGNWYAGPASVAWEAGYSQASPAAYSCSLRQPGFMADYGDDVLGGTGTGDGWTAAEVYEVAWGIRTGCALPEIYYAGMAAEWAALSQWGAANTSTGRIVFTGVMTEAAFGSYGPTVGWEQLGSATGQTPPALTEIGSALLGPPPSVSSVRPAYGPESGGTSVTISGRNLLGIQAVYFGATPAASFKSLSATSATAVAPAQGAATVNVLVETAMGTSAASPTTGFQYVPPPCTAVAVTAAAASAAPGYQDLATASATCPAGAQVKYSYFTRAGTSGPWTLDAAWAGSSWKWHTAGLSPGQYQLLVWASDGPYTVPQASATVTIHLSTICSVVTGSPSPEPAEPGSAVAVSGVATCPAGASPKFSYFVRTGTSGTWKLQAVWTGPIWKWNTTGLPPGRYQVLVWVSGGPYTIPQAQVVVPITLAWPAPCSGETVSAPGSISPGASGSISAQATCPTGTVARYTYFVRAGGSGPWRLKAAWVGNSWNWDTAGFGPGTYEVLVWASDGPYTVPQVQRAVTVRVAWPAACSSITASGPGSVPPQVSASIAALATCPAGAAAKYSYFVRAGESGPWSLKAAWVGKSWSWNTAGLGFGTYEVLVWASDGPYTVPQVQTAVTVTLAWPAPCSAETATGPASATSGTPVSIVAQATCPSGDPAKYSYFVRSGTSGAWRLMAAWVGATWTWRTPGVKPGTYQILVWASDGPFTLPQIQRVVSVVVT